jgi:hypothetical protein
MAQANRVCLVEANHWLDRAFTAASDGLAELWMCDR